MKNQFPFLWPTFGICLSDKTLILLINNWNTNRQEKQAITRFETAKRPVFIVKAVLEGLSATSPESVSAPQWHRFRLMFAS